MVFNSFVFVLLLKAGITAYAYTLEAIADQVTNLPGAENLDITFNQFSGYLPVNGSRNMHYWFVESMNDPVNDPITFWTNGGPMCSGLIGFMSEQGPFRPNKDMTLSFNEYAWNQVSNMVFVEQPCGVGFSYSDNAEDDRPNDASVAIDNYLLIQEFMTRFPEYSTNDLYYTSESYGGHYLPMLSKEIVDRNAEGTFPVLNYKGFAVGNPATTFYSTWGGRIDTYWGHQLVAKPTWDQYAAECKDDKRPHNISLCMRLFADIMVHVGNLNPYALDYPVCTSDTGEVAGSGTRVDSTQRAWLMHHLFADAAPEVKQALGLLPLESYEPCEEDFMTTWINQDSVKSALNVKSDIQWQKCSSMIQYQLKDCHDDMTPYYKYLIDNQFGLNILVYSGDDDTVCSTVGTQSWIWDLGYVPSGSIWQKYQFEGQTAGYFSQWKDTKLGFLTIHGAGHEVPTYKPEIALDMFVKYLKGTWTSA